MRNNRISAVLWAGIGLVMPVIPLFFYFSGNWYSFFHSYSLSMVLGIFSYGYFLNTLILSARIPFLDRLFGHDRVMVFHGYYASLGFLLAIGHYIFKKIFSIESSAQVIFGAAAFAIFFSVIAVTSLVMISGVMQRFPPIAKLKAFAGKTWIGDYSKLKLFHNTVSIAVMFLAFHVYMASSTQESLARMWIMGAWAGIALAVYLFHKIIRVMILYKGKWKIAEITELTPEIIELRLQPGKKILRKHRAGQFAYVRVMSKVCGIEEHPFTISSAPGEPELILTIKNLGDYTARLKNIPAGTSVLVDGPYGVFTPDRSEKQTLFIAGGIGITPFLSILKDWDLTDQKGPVTLVWSCRTFREMIHREFLEELEKEYPQFCFIPVATREKEGNGRIDRDLLGSLLEPEICRSAAAYICGPDKLRRSCVKNLKEIGLSSDNIHFENFSS